MHIGMFPWVSIHVQGTLLGLAQGVWAHSLPGPMCYHVPPPGGLPGRAIGTLYYGLVGVLSKI